MITMKCNGIRERAWCSEIRRPTLLVVIVISVGVTLVHAQTEGDTGYEYNGVEHYDEDYDDDSVIGIDPSFDVPIVNVTVVKGQTAVLPCSIENLGKFKVAWLDNTRIPLTYEDRRVVDDTRFSIVRPQVKEWNLQVRDIRPEDEGRYRCTINTNPVRSKQIVLHVKVPAEIIDELSSSDITVQEGETVRILCNVSGVPTPYVTWNRKSQSSHSVSVRPNRMCKQRSSEGDTGVIGAVLIIENVSRHCDDTYECEASNGVPPSVTRQIRVTVEFKPHVKMPNRRIGQQRNRETILECSITAFPHAVNFWEKDGKQLTNSLKYRIEAYDEGDHMLTLSLRIQIADFSDFGEYRCIASNSLGKDEGTMTLYEYTDADLRPVTTRLALSDWLSATISNNITPENSATAFNYHGIGKTHNFNQNLQNGQKAASSGKVDITQSYMRDPKYTYASSWRVTSNSNAKHQKPNAGFTVIAAAIIISTIRSKPSEYLQSVFL